MQKSNSTAVPELQQSPYEVLGVAKFATPDEIKTAYRKMAMVVPLNLLLIANCLGGYRNGTQTGTMEKMYARLTPAAADSPLLRCRLRKRRLSSSNRSRSHVSTQSLCVLSLCVPNRLAMLLLQSFLCLCQLLFGLHQRLLHVPHHRCLAAAVPLLLGLL